MGHEVIITTRPYSIDRSNDNLDRLGRKHISLGEYGGDLKSWLINGSNRIIELTHLIDRERPDVLISFPSPDAFRTAFGLNIPAIQINDTPHSTAVGRLTISLAKGLVHSKAIDNNQFAKLGVTNFYPYNGIDEVLWIRNYEPELSVIEELGLQKEKYVVLRCEESKAAYFRRMFPEVEPGATMLLDLINYLTIKDPELKIIAFPRYPEQEKSLRELDVIIPQRSVDTLSLFYFSKGVLTAGGTMGREAALLGTPTMYTFPYRLEVSTYVTENGFPLIHHSDTKNLHTKFWDLISTDKMDNSFRKDKLNQMEDPFDGIQRALKTELGWQLS